MHTGRALCIGVDTSESPGGLAEADALALAEVARGQGFFSSTLLGAAATRASVCAQLRKAAAECAPGDLFMLTFSGHGGRRHVGQADAGGGLRSTWVLYDGSLDDAEMRAALAEFRPRVRVLVISDSCNGGVPAYPCTPAATSVSASVLVLSACGEDRYADAAGLPGHFTTALLRTWRSRAVGSGHRAFFDAVAAAMPDYQRPAYYWVGTPDAHFEAQPPFTI